MFVPFEQRRTPRSLATALAGRDNSLNAIRLVLASSVILGHAHGIVGVPDPTDGRLGALAGQAVNGFFILSGYLIAGSAARTGLLPYLWRRFIRIMPAFWVVLVVTGFIFAPLSVPRGGGSWSPTDGLAYVTANAALYINQFGVGDTLSAVPFSLAWNGSLWTLFYEFAAYVASGLLLAVPIVRRHMTAVFGTLFVALVVLQPLALGPLEVHHGLYIHSMRLGAFFLVGSLLYALGDRVPRSGRLAALSAVVLLVLAYFKLDFLFGQLPMAYALLWLGSSPAVKLGRVNDISYGIYVYGFPSQQIVFLAVGGTGGLLLNTALALGLAVPLAAASWFLVEKPAMRLRNLVPAGRPQDRMSSAKTPAD